MTETGPGAASRSPSLRTVMLPSEHGGWSLTLEPALLGLIVAPSGAGWALAGAALLGFLLRTPLKLALGDLLRRRALVRTAMAARAALAYGVTLCSLLAVALLTSDHVFWPPLAMAAPLFAVELAYDVRARSRRLVPELVGTVGIGAVAAAIVLADGGETAVAYGLWAVAAARAVAAIPFVRVQLRRGKGQPYRLASSDLAQLPAVLGAAAATPVLGPIPALAVLGLAIFHTVAVRRPVPRTAIIGAQQVVLGLTVVVVTALAALAP